MVPFIKTTIALGLTALISGCASGPVQVDQDRSRAGNLALAAGLNLPDATVPAGEFDEANSLAYDTTWHALMLGSRHGLAWDRWDSLAGGLVLSLLAPDEPYERDSLFGWMPTRLADNEKEASRTFLETYTDATQAFFDANDIDYIEESPGQIETHGFVAKTLTLIDEEKGCPNLYTGMTDAGDHSMDDGEDWHRMCVLLFMVRDEPNDVAEVPPMIAEHDAPAYLFTSGNPGHVSYLEVNQPEGAAIDPTAIMLGISQHLPQWAYMYRSPVADERPAMVIDHGQPAFFIVPEAEAPAES